MVQPGGPAARLLENLPQRPPTPPRESDQRSSNLLTRWFSKSLGTQTPPDNSPQSSAESPNHTSAEKSGKKVEWSTRTEYRYPSGMLGKDPGPLQQVLRPLPPSGNQKPAKSILKPYNGIISIDRSQGTTKLAPPHSYPNFAIMLESIVKQLAGEDRSSRLDGYMTLSGVLKASENIPDPASLKNKMGLLTQFIQRDMSAKTQLGSPDTVLINNALILLASLLARPPASESLPTDFCAYFMDHTITVFEDSQVSKDIIRHLMFILANQSFSVRIMTQERVGRLIKALHSIENHVKGKSIVLGRLSIYKKLLKQTKPFMVMHVDWVEDVFSDMLSTLKDIRTPVIDFALEAAFELGTDSRPSRAVMDLFQLGRDEGKYGEFYARRLTQMIRKKQDGPSVPQIWSAAVLFLRSRQGQFEHWEFMQSWLKIIQECFNNSDYEVKYQANLAWNRLVFVVRLDEPAMVKMLCNPLNAQLKRKQNSKNAREARQCTIDSICNLLYYAMRPSTSFTQLDLYWDACVTQLMGNLLPSTQTEGAEISEADLKQACGILGALLDNSSGFSKVWKLNRASWKKPIGSDELPSLDPKWIRKNHARVLDVIEPLIEHCFGDLKDENNAVLPVWKCFMSSVALAGAKEVKVSNETMACLARILTLLNKIWMKGPKSIQPAKDTNNTNFLVGFECLFSIVISSLGVLPFTEKLLSINQQEGFAVVSTPSHVPTKQTGNIKSPLYHLFSLITQPPSDLICDENYFSMVEAIISPFFQDRKSKWSRVELAKELVQLIPSQPSGKASNILWEVLATLVSAAIDRGEDSGSNSSHSLPLGTGFRNLLNILEFGTILSTANPSEVWKALYAASSNQITMETGESGRALSLIEPLARSLRMQSIKNECHPSISYCSILVANATYPKDRQALDAAHRRLWGASPAAQKPTSLDPYEQLYAFLKLCLEDSYLSFTSDYSDDHVDLLLNVVDLLRRCPSSNVLHVLTSVQEGLASWIADPDNKLGGRKISEVSVSVLNLWEDVCASIIKLPETDSHILELLTVLISSGLESRHKSIVTKAINVWNTTFGSQPSLEYPTRVKDALARLRPIADIELPSFPESIDSRPDPSISYLLDSQEDLIAPEPPRPASRGRYRTPQLSVSPLPQPRSTPDLHDIDPQSSSRKHFLDYQIQSGKRKIIKRDLTPKLRHDDSQIQFTAIESSPLADAAFDSQLLTERQREVKERQQVEAASLFPDLRSSPLVRSTSPLPKLTLNSGLPKTQSNEAPSTPSISRGERSVLNEYITSSPTPRREIIEIPLDSDAIEPPSSPPEPSRAVSPSNDVQVPQTDDKDTREPVIEIWDVPSSPPNDIREASNDAFNHPIPSIEMVDETTDIEADQEPLLQAPVPERPKTPERQQSASSVDLQDAKTPNDQFVEASSSPVFHTPVNRHRTEDVYVDALTSPEENISSSRRSTRSSKPVAVPEIDEAPGSGRMTRSRALHKSSSLSELDEDSMIRLMTEIDETSKAESHPVNANVLGQIVFRDDTAAGTGHLSSTSEFKDTPMEDLLDHLGSKETMEERTDDAIMTSEAIRSDVDAPLHENFPSVGEPSGIPSGNNDDVIKENQMVEESDVSPQKTNKRKRVSSRLQSQSNPEIKRTKITQAELAAEVPDSQDNITALSDITKLVQKSESGVGKQPGRRGRKPKTSRRSRSQHSQSETPFTNDESVSQLDPVADVSQQPITPDAETTELSKAGNTLLEQTTEASLQAETIVQDKPEEYVQSSIHSGEKLDGFQESIESPQEQNPDVRVDEHLAESLEEVIHSNEIATVAPTIEDVGGCKESETDKTGLDAVLGRFESFLESLRTAKLSREEADKMEYMLWDAKRELGAAEFRGRS